MTPMLRPVMAFTGLETKLSLRDPATLFFVFISPIGLFFSFEIFSRFLSKADFYSNGQAFCAAVSLVILTISLFSVFARFVHCRESGFFKRLLVTPIQPLAILLATLLRALLVATVAVVVLAIAALATGLMPMPVAPLELLLAYLVGASAFLSIAVLISTFVEKMQSAMSIAVLLLQPLLFLSGIAIPLSVMPGAIAHFAMFMPSYYLMQTLRLGWSGLLFSSAAVIPLAVLFASAVISVAVARKTFRWFT